MVEQAQEFPEHPWKAEGAEEDSGAPHGSGALGRDQLQGGAGGLHAAEQAKSPEGAEARPRLPEGSWER